MWDCGRRLPGKQTLLEDYVLNRGLSESVDYDTKSCTQLMVYRINDIVDIEQVIIECM